MFQDKQEITLMIVMLDLEDTEVLEVEVVEVVVRTHRNFLLLTEEEFVLHQMTFQVQAEMDSQVVEVVQLIRTLLMVIPHLVVTEQELLATQLRVVLMTVVVVDMLLVMLIKIQMEKEEQRVLLVRVLAMPVVVEVQVVVDLYLVLED